MCYFTAFRDAGLGDGGELMGVAQHVVLRFWEMGVTGWWRAVVGGTIFAFLGDVGMRG